MSLAVCNKTGISFQCSQCYHGREHLHSEDCKDECPRNKEATCIKRKKEDK